MKSILDFLANIFDELTDVIEEILRPRTFFAFMFYATFCYLVLRERPIPDSLINIVSTILGFWFGNKVGIANGKENGNDAKNNPNHN